MTAPPRPSSSEIVAGLESLLPSIRERAHDAEARRSVHPETIEELSRLGVFRTLQPERYGGYAMDWGVQIDIARRVGAVCGSTAWLVTVLTTHAAMVGRFPRRAQDDVWGEDPDARIATASARLDATAVQVEGGYEVGGIWRFASGIDHSGWVIVAAPVEGDDTRPPGNLRQFLIPAAQYEIVDDWHVAGLRATGSRQVRVAEGTFIPDHRSIGFLELLGTDPPGSADNDGYIYSMEFGPYFGTILLGPVLGLAEGALAEYVESTRTRVDVTRGNRIAEGDPVQVRLAESAAQIAAAGLLLDRMLGRFHEKGQAGVLLSAADRAESMRDRAFITKSCTDAVFRLSRHMGARGLSDDNPVQRQFRDITAASAQIGLAWDRNMSMYGKWALGIPTGDRAIDGDAPAVQDDPSDSVA